MANSHSTDAVSHVAAESVLDGPAPKEAYQHDYFPRYATLSKSHWELWIFDGVDAEANVAVTMTFFREGPQVKMGKGPLRVTFQAILPDGTTLRGEEHCKESTIEAGADSIRGRWVSAKDGAGSAEFEVKLDLSEAEVRFQLPALQGSLKLRRAGPAVSTPTTTDSEALLAPAVYYVHALPRAVAQVDFTFLEQGKRLEFSGLGGGDHCWNEESTPAIMEACTYVRAHAGPYTLSVMRVVSRMEPGKTFTKATLVQDGEEIFRCTSDGRISLTDDYLSFRSAHGGPVRGGFGDAASGYKVDCVSPGQHRHWSFELDHHLLWWAMPTAPPPAKTGNSGFVDVVRGGEVGGETHTGSATAGHVELPFLKSQYSGFNNHPPTAKAP